MAIGNNELTLSPAEQAILEYVKKYEKITNSEVQKLTGLKPSRVRYILIEMCNKGLLKGHGAGRYKQYKLN